MVSRVKVGWAAAAAKTGSERRARARWMRTVGALLSLGSWSKSGRGLDPAKGAAFITLLGKRVPSHCHPSRGARQPMGTRREVRKAGGGSGEGRRGAPSSLLPGLSGTGHSPVTSWTGLGLSGAFRMITQTLRSPLGSKKGGISGMPGGRGAPES